VYIQKIKSFILSSCAPGYSLLAIRMYKIKDFGRLLNANFKHPSFRNSLVSNLQPIGLLPLSMST